MKSKTGLIILLLLLFAAFTSAYELTDFEMIHFLHHSTGNGVYAYPAKGVPAWFNDYNAAQGTNFQISHRYYPHTPYPWANYPYDYWNLWVNGSCSNSDPDIECMDSLAQDYDVIIYKHCYPGSDILADTGSPDITSSRKSTENYKLQYRALRDLMDSYPDTIFILWTLPPRNEAQTNPENAQRATDFADWVKGEFLSENREHPNIYIFDFRNIVMGSDNYLADEYADGSDSHPNDAGNNAAGPLFAQFIIDSITDFVNSGVCNNDGSCLGDENCQNCPADCPTPNNRVCCNGTIHVGDCCSDVDCNGTQCESYVCGGLEQAPTVTNLQCRIDQDYMNCSSLSYGDTITGVRAQCTDDGSITNSILYFFNVDDSNTYYMVNGTSLTGDYWGVEASSLLTLQESGWTIIYFHCVDDVGVPGETSTDFSLPWGTLESEQILPLGGDFNVTQNQTFTFQTKLSCSVGECGNVTATLDPSESFREGLNAHSTTYDSPIRSGATYPGDDSSWYVNYHFIKPVIVFPDILGNAEGQIPPEALIISAELTFDLLQWGGDGAGTINLYRITDPNNEGVPLADSETTWDARHSAAQWVASGGDYNPQAEASITLLGNEASGTKFTADVTQTVQYWADNYNADSDIAQGWILEYTENRGAYFCSSEHSTASRRPTLTVEYEVGGGGVAIGKGVIPMNSGSPFYTTSENPTLCSDMVAGDVCVINWSVHTNSTNGTYEFFVEYEPVYAGCNSEVSPSVNITIVEAQVDSSCSLPNDEPPCGCINSDELVVSINSWYEDIISLSDLMNNVLIWKNGC